MSNDKSEFKIQNLPAWLFGIAFVVVIVAMFFDALPDNMIGAFAVMIAIGGVMGLIGSRVPILKDYLGGPPIVAIFGTAALDFYGIIPSGSANTVAEFMNEGGFLAFYIAALITGSILGMDSKLLVYAGARYALPLFAGLFGSMILVGIVGGLIGYGWQDAIAYLAMPIMGGGMGAGAVPMSEIYSEFLGVEVSEVLSILVPALALGNLFAIVTAGLLNQLGKVRPSLTGEGQLIKGSEYHHEEEEEEAPKLSLMGAGLFLSTVFFVFGVLLNQIIEPIHAYALMILTVAICKVSGLIPAELEKGANHWYKFIAGNLTLALLVGIGIEYTDMGDVLAALSIEYVVLVLMVIIGATLGAGAGGYMVGFNAIESALTAGLCMANMGGTGDVAVLSASDRMSLMPFAQISSRLGGALMLIVASTIIPFIF